MSKDRRTSRAVVIPRISQEYLRPGERVGVAVSGGADSVALLLLLLELSERIGIVPCVVHFNHKLRGKESDADEKFVAALARKYDLEFFRAQEDIAAKSKREKINLEDAARRARYAFFERLVSEGNVDRVAVAHTADDQAETVLAHILRGTGLAGLGGIHPEAGAVFRPLLGVRRTELRSYLHSKRQRWRQDASNRDMARNRARIRLKLMPSLERNFQPAVVEHLCQLAEFSREDEAYLDAQTEALGEQVMKVNKQEVRVPLAELLTLPKAMQTRLIRRAVGIVKGVIPAAKSMVGPTRIGQLGAAHVKAVLHLARDQDSGKEVQLPGGVEVQRNRDGLRFLASAANAQKHVTLPETEEYSYSVDLRTGRAEVSILELSRVVRFRVIDWPPEGRETNVTGALLHWKKLRSPLVVRNWKPGDAMRPLGCQKQHKLARLLNEIGVSRWEKVSWPVLTDGEQVLWARGLPVAAEFAASNATRAEVLIIEEQES